MKFLHFTQSLETLYGGGLGSSTLALHRQMRAKGIVSKLCSTYRVQAQCPSDDISEFKRVNPGFIYYAPAMKREAPALVRQADIVHGHGLYTGVNFVIGGEAIRQRKPLVYHIHGFLEPYILNRSRWKKRLVHWLFEDANFRHVSLLRALTSVEADQIRACGLKQPIVIAPNGLDPAAFPKPADPNAPICTPWLPSLVKKRFRMLFLARIHPKKGLDMLIPALSKIRSLTKDWELVVAGPDELNHLAEVRQQVNALNLADQVIFTGSMAGAAKVALLHSADLFVLPSYSEGFPMSLLEAAACGVPVLATRTCNFPEVSSAETGWECDPTAESLAGTLSIALQATASERKQRGENGRSLLEIRYSWASVIDSISEASQAVC